MILGRCFGLLDLFRKAEGKLCPRDGGLLAWAGQDANGVAWPGMGWPRPFFAMGLPCENQWFGDSYTHTFIERCLENNHNVIKHRVL